MMSIEHARHLMMAALDGEISAKEQGELDSLLADDAELKAEWEEMQQVKEVMGTMALKAIPEEVFENYWASGVYRRVERGIGWILVSIGVAIVTGWGTWEVLAEIFAETAIPMFVKIGIVALVVGSVILFVSVLREKLKIRAKDPFKEVQR